MNSTSKKSTDTVHTCTLKNKNNEQREPVKLTISKRITHSKYKELLIFKIKQIIVKLIILRLYINTTITKK